MASDPTIGEVWRGLEEVKAALISLSSDLRGFQHDLASAEYNTRIANLESRVASLEEERVTAGRWYRESVFRWIILIAGALAMVVAQRLIGAG